MESEPELPSTGWTMREAAAALLPEMLADADGRPPKDWWMAGGAVYKAAERKALHRAFARIMESGQYRATGLVKELEEPIAPLLWRAARFGLGLQGDSASEDHLFAAGKVFKGVRVYRPALENTGSPRAAADSDGAGKGRLIEAGTEWWTACQVYTWVAFGEARPLFGNVEFPRAEWSRKWRDWPPDELSKAFVCIGMNKPWGEPTWGTRGEEHCMAVARAIMAETKDTAESLNDALAADIEQWQRNKEALVQAFRDVMDAVRAGRLTVRARRALPNGTPDINAGHEELDAAKWFLGPRAISLSGGVEYTGESSIPLMVQTPLEALFDYTGPRWDDAQFIAGQVQAEWSASMVRQRSKTAATAGAEKQLQKWLEAEMRKSPASSPGKREMMRRATIAKHSFSGEGFQRAWVQAVLNTGAAGWSKAGAKSKGANRGAK